jgi:carboxyl-terminal processing protease
MTRRFTARVAVALVVVLAGCGGSVGPSAPVDPRPYAAAYDRFWSDFDRTYSYFTYKQVDWNAGRDALRERAAVVTSDSALVTVLLDAVAPLRDVHVWFRRPSGTTRPSYVPPRQVNWNRDLWLAQLPRLGWHQGNTNWGWGRVGDVGYIAVGAWNDAQVRMADIDAALEQLRETRALVVDVRMNGGGNDALALQLAARFTTRSVTFGRVRFRDGPSHDDFGPWTNRTVGPRGAWQYVKPVWLLVGAACFSSNETFIAAMRELPNVTVAGDMTGGSSGNPREFPLVVGGRSTGWQYSVPRWVETLADGTVIEWNGITPDVAIAWDAAAIQAGRDPVLDRAFRELGVVLP